MNIYSPCGTFVLFTPDPKEMTMPQTSLCNDLESLADAIEIFPFIGVQAYLAISILIHNVATILSDILAFVAVIHQVWGLWKEKRRLGLHTGKDFATLVLQQDFCIQFKSPQILPIPGTYVGVFQNVLSTILICEFTLDLRRRNTRSLPNLSPFELPDLNLSSQDNPVRSIRPVLGRLQESIIADMGERSDPIGLDGLGQLEGEPDAETA
ncbi:hypothetical protein Clacol_004572 [Clathrus columnatus]|uniref:Uncharacterized protein n=1 Tax=Clathrus columnatus TaxID=1419009 RepID=A0AAV5ABD7_9AGAM|nr:hypothetical protein Clacol_004572 [Clathrus columnatus]